jgi:hypothetical protein
VLFTIIDRKSRSNRVRKITNPVELSLLQLRDQALYLQNRENPWPVRKISWSSGSCPSLIALFTIIDRKSRSNRVRIITNPVELSLLQLRDQALHLQTRVRKSVASQENLLELRFLSLVNHALHHHRQEE